MKEPRIKAVLWMAAQREARLRRVAPKPLVGMWVPSDGPRRMTSETRARRRGRRAVA